MYRYVDTKKLLVQVKVDITRTSKSRDIGTSKSRDIDTSRSRVISTSKSY